MTCTACTAQATLWAGATPVTKTSEQPGAACHCGETSRGGSGGGRVGRGGRAARARCEAGRARGGGSEEEAGRPGPQSSEAGVAGERPRPARRGRRVVLLAAPAPGPSPAPLVPAQASLKRGSPVWPCPAFLGTVWCCGKDSRTLAGIGSGCLPSPPERPAPQSSPPSQRQTQQAEGVRPVVSSGRESGTMSAGTGAARG